MVDSVRDSALRRVMGSDYVPQFIKATLDIIENLDQSGDRIHDSSICLVCVVLDALSDVSLVYPSQVKTAGNRLKLFCLARIDQPVSAGILAASSACLSFVASCYGLGRAAEQKDGGAKSKPTNVNHNSWQNLCADLLGHLYSSLLFLGNRLGAAADERGSEKISAHSFRLPNLPPNGLPLSVGAATRIRGLCVYLKGLFTRPISQPPFAFQHLEVPVDNVILVLMSGLSIPANHIDPNHRQAARFCVTGIHNDLLSFLKCFVEACGRGLLPHAFAIHDMLAKNLVSARAGRNGTTIAATYRVISSTARIYAGALSSDRLDEILDGIITDSKSDRYITQIQSQGDAKAGYATGKEGKRKRGSKKKSSKPLSQGIGGAGELGNAHIYADESSTSGIVRADLTAAALEAACIILQSAGAMLGFAARSRFCRFVLWQLRCTEKAPYRADYRCRLGLYQALIASLVVTGTASPLPLAEAMKLFEMGTRDSDGTISAECNRYVHSFYFLVCP